MSYQFLRQFNLIVAKKNGQALDLSQLHCKFSIKRSGVMTPNVASIRVYNLAQDTANTIKKEFTNVILQAGYQGNYGAVFNGGIKQCIIGRESQTETFLDIFAGDGDQAYNYAVVNQTLAAGSSVSDHLTVAMTAMNPYGVSAGYQSTLPTVTLPRGKVLYGNARDYVQRIAQSSNSTWSIQDGKAIFIKLTQYLPSQAIVITTKTGMIGTPQQTIEGIRIKTLLNPKIKIHGRVKIDNASVAQFRIDFTQPGSPANTPVPLTNDGVYYVYTAEHSGDTRGQDWSTTILGITIDPTNNPLNNGGVSLT